jgi:hypothetical protein
MSTNIGKDGAVYVGSNAVAEIRDWSLEITSEIINDTVMGDTWMTNKATQKSWTASFNAYWDPTDSLGQEGLTEGTEVTLNLYPTGNSSSNYYWSGSAIVNSVSKSGSYDGFIEASFSVTGNGPLAQDTVV